MSEFDYPTVGEVDCFNLDDYITTVFGDTPRPTGSVPILVDDPEWTETDVFRLLGAILEAGLRHCVGDDNWGYMSDVQMAHIRNCFRATGFDILLNPVATDPLVSQCLPTQSTRKKCLKMPKSRERKEFMTVMFYPLRLA
jgi:hypothetical protein